jgi:tRNA(fMet)-specific endonuclease VapC
LLKGKPIPENDIWIAASAMQYQIPLFTHDRHFNEVEGISIV